MSGFKYRPVTDTWILARAKLNNNETYYGSFPGGFPERARTLLGVSINDPVLHVCGGKVRLYPYKNAIGPNDKTIDLDQSLNPDFLQDVREPLPFGFAAHLADPAYGPDEQKHYEPGEEKYPLPNSLVKNMIESLDIGRRCGILHYIVPQPPKNARLIAMIGVIVGYNNRIRVYTVFERI